MKIPLGPIIRAVWPGTWIGKIFQKTKGISIEVGGHEIQLDERHTMPTRGQRKPHRPGTTHR